MKNEPKNIEAFQKLVERYETITSEEINKTWIEFDGDRQFYVAEKLTGIGARKCTLCSATKTGHERDCFVCVYGRGTAYIPQCVEGINEHTYNAIVEAESPKQLLSAFRARAAHLRKTYPQYLR